MTVNEVNIMKTNQTKKQMMNNLLHSINFNIQEAKRLFELYGSDDPFTCDAITSAVTCINILCTLGFITGILHDELIYKLCFRKFDEITLFEVDYSCIIDKENTV